MEHDGDVFAGMGIIFATYMQAIKNIRQSIVINLFRQAVILLPLMFILSRAFGMVGVWVAFPIAEITTCLYSFGVYKKASAKIGNLQIMQ